MGRSEEKSRKRRSPSTSSLEDNRRKKHRTRDDRERNREDKKEKKNKRREERKERDKSKKSHKKSSRHKDKGMKSAEKHDKKRSKSRHHSDFEELTNDDYYSKNNEFSTWLKEEKGLFFSDLSSEDARKLFSGFVEDWNCQKLESHYYEGIASGPRTAHNWKIAPEK